MAGKVTSELKAKTDAAWTNLTRQLQGMESHLDRSDAPGQWTTREVLSHLLFQPGWDPTVTLKSFAPKTLPVIDIEPGKPYLNDERKRMSLKQLVDAIDEQRRQVFAVVAPLSDDELQTRKARIPLFKQFMGTEEIPLAQYVGALFDFHWNDHAGQIAKIRKAVGLPPAG
ncbi:MAG: hypothetical protein DMD89_07200 [Candidatus Rokuibacteriota bacterium]|nr:MAG: hypothetical protein DMD89_07200 [Candidatus Rokubacteria bacterium]